MPATPTSGVLKKKPKFEYQLKQELGPFWGSILLHMSWCLCDTFWSVTQEVAGWNNLCKKIVTEFSENI